MTDALRAGAATARVDGEGLMIRQVRVAIERGTDRGRHIVSRSARVVIGSQAGVDLVVDDPAVSRFHCEITIDGGRARLRDLGSRNGTTVDGVVVRDADLHAGAKITVGRTQLRFEVEPDHVRIPVSERSSFGRLVGATPGMREVFALLERAAAGDATVLLEGETGTGKDAAAESIHDQSARRDKPMIVIDCGALPSALIESELFGHERGAFTGAASARIGAFEAADGGTVFLDEIGELPIELQPKLLRVLERREVKRLGATEYTHIDVRVIAATNRDLRQEVNARRFRSDLYWRLAVITVRLPPLRDRGEDLPLLVDSLLAAYPPAVRDALRSPAFAAELAYHSWPGNVRELRNHLDRCAALGPELAPPLSGSAPAPGDHAPPIDAARPLREAREDWTRQGERRYLEDLLRRHPDNLAAAARAAGVDRAYVYRLLWKHNLR